MANGRAICVFLSQDVAVGRCTRTSTGDDGDGNTKRVPALDGIRGIAILLVLIDHLAPYAPVSWGIWRLAMGAGWVGVDLFFVLSGFLITGILLRTKAASNRASSFYARRALRIFPIYYLVLLIAFSIAGHSAWLRSNLPSPAFRITYFAYLQNLFMYHGPGFIPTNILGHFWSLAVEEQFYLVWPWLVWILPGRILPRVCVVGAICSLFVRTALVIHFGPHFWISALTPTSGDGLLVGSAIAAVGATGEFPARWLRRMALAGASTLALIAMLHAREFANTDTGFLACTIGISGLAVLFGALVGSSRRFVPVLTPILKSSPLRSLGKYSYGVYVYHIPVYMTTSYFAASALGISISQLSTACAFAYLSFLVALSIAVAWASFALFEGRLLDLKEHFGPIYRTTHILETRSAAVSGARAMTIANYLKDTPAD